MSAALVLVTIGLVAVPFMFTCLIAFCKETASMHALFSRMAKVLAGRSKFQPAFLARELPMSSSDAGYQDWQTTTARLVISFSEIAPCGSATASEAPEGTRSSE